MIRVVYCSDGFVVKPETLGLKRVDSTDAASFPANGEVLDIYGSTNVPRSSLPLLWKVSAEIP
jgi:hypothetical protein